MTDLASRALAIAERTRAKEQSRRDQLRAEAPEDAKWLDDFRTWQGWGVEKPLKLSWLRVKATGEEWGKRA